MWVLEQKKYNILNSIQQTNLFLIFFLFFGFSLYSVTGQEKIWLDQNHKETVKEKAVYYRPSPKKKRNEYFIVDYYKNGNKYREGKAEFSTVGRERFIGVVTYYFNNGTISKREKYKKGLLDGLYKEYYLSGELKVDGAYDKGFEEGIWKYYQKTGKIKTKGRYKNGEKVGKWTTYYRNVYYPEDE